MNKDQTTEQIKRTLGATYTVNEVEGFLAKAEEQSAKQAPYFDGRLLDRITLLKTALESKPTWKRVSVEEGSAASLCWPILFRNSKGIFYGPLRGETLVRETPAGNFYIKQFNQ